MSKVSKRRAMLRKRTKDAEAAADRKMTLEALARMESNGNPKGEYDAPDREALLMGDLARKH